MQPQRILVTGSTGFLGPFVIDALQVRGLEVVTASRSGGDATLDLSDPSSSAAAAQALAPDFVLNLAAMSHISGCEADPVAAHRVNALFPGELAKRFGDRLLHVSTDQVFSGDAAPYSEDDETEPLSAYGRSKLASEKLVREGGGRVVRLPLLFGPDGRGRGASSKIRMADETHEVMHLYTNEYRTPLHAADAGAGLAEFVTQRSAPPTLHMPGPERCSRWELGRRLCEAHGIDLAVIQPAECKDAMRPRDVSLRGDWKPLRTFDEMLADC